MSVLTLHDGGFSDFWSRPDPESFSISWLGQSGFAVRAGSHRFLVDPYLSDSLEVKYRGSERPHDRMMPPPARVADLAGLQLVFCTHAHSDHMDPETLPAIARDMPACRFVLPRAHVKKAGEIGVPDAVMLPLDAGESLDFPDGLSVRAIPAAHEQLETDSNGHHLFLGYLWQWRGTTIYHSGDCVPYEGLAGAIRKADLALLPVNGCGRGVPGNFSFEEAVQLCRTLNIPHLIPHHFGMFSFNTVSRSDLEKKASGTSSPGVSLPAVSSWFTLNNL